MTLCAVLAFAGCTDSDEGPGAPSSVNVVASEDTIVLSSDAQITTASKSIVVECVKNSGNPDFKLAWTLSSNQPWLKLTLDVGGSDAVQVLESEASRTVYLVVEENSEMSLREATITLNDETTPVATVSQEGFKPGTITVAPASYPALGCDAQTPAPINLTVTCVRHNGEPDPLAAWSLVSNQPWLRLTLNADGSEADVELEGAGTQNVYVVADENSGTEDRTARIVLNGAAEPALTITQTKPVTLPALPVPQEGLLDGIEGAGELPSAESAYVGAFWRASQIGERVIRSYADGAAGAWTATVAWYDASWNPAAGDGVVLAAGDSTDPAIRTDNPADAEGYRVEGTQAAVSGTVDADGFIVFRIGLTSAFKAYDERTAPARYAVVLLTYADGAKKQKIFLRQGEGADYIMRPGDKDGSGAAVADDRAYARRFLPYNLTASASQWASAACGATYDTYPQLAVRGGTLVQYPSQGGAAFQGQASSDAWLRRAFSSVYTDEITKIAKYSGEEAYDAAANEICPAGYRRMQDGPVGEHATQKIPGSEMRQSVWLNPVEGVGTNAFDLGNSAWGYYADGFFDRRKMADKTDVVAADAAVAAATHEAAYKGRIFFNPETQASCFFPAAGYRTTKGYQKAGTAAYYWSGTTVTAKNLSCLYISNTRACPYSQDRGYSWSMRCVRDE